MFMSNVRHKETGELYDAVKHDGSDEQAKRITTWINRHLGRAQFFPKGTVDYDLHQAFVLLLQDGDPQFVRRGFWVIRRESDNCFFVVFGDDLTEHWEYVPSNDRAFSKYKGDVEKAFNISEEDLDARVDKS
jgi:hypothetical protein